MKVVGKLFIENRKDEKISVVVDKCENQQGLAFVMHGLGGFKEQPHIQTFAQAFKDAGYTIVLFDTTNTFGESDGKYEDATTTNYYEDLEDVILWASEQSWYQEPFCLAGHSLGGYCTARYAELHPKKVKALAPISVMISGELSAQTAKHQSYMEEWKRTGWRIYRSETDPTRIKRLKWSHML